MNDMNPTGGLVTRCLLNQRVFRHYRSIYWPQQVLLDKIARNANLKSLSQLSLFIRRCHTNAYLHLQTLGAISPELHLPLFHHYGGIYWQHKRNRMHAHGHY